MIHLFKCRYECQNFGFWGLFLAGRFCVYITQMNFLFYRFFLFVLFVALPLFTAFLFFFLFFYCFVLLPLIRAIYPIVFCAYCQPGRGGVTFGSLVNVPRYHVIELPYYLRLQFEVLKTCHIVLRLKILQLLGYPSTTARRGC